MNFKRFLVEMETTPDEKDKLRTIIGKLIQDDNDWLAEQNIYVNNKGQYWVLNYQPGPANEYNKLTRGLIVQKPPVGFNQDPLSLIHSFPFIRFFNQHEKEAAQVNLANAEMLEKLDGTFVGVFFPERDPKRPQWQTRKMISTHQKDIDMTVPTFTGKKYKLLSLIGDYVKKLNFTDEDVDYTFMFEFIHEASHIVTRYEENQHGLYLIGARNVDTHRELKETDLDKVAAKLGVRRPQRWHTTGSKEEIADLMRQAKEKTTDFEGFIFRDKDTGKRIKVKDLDYLRKHRMLDSTKTLANFMPLVLQGEEGEIVSNFPHLKGAAELINRQYKSYVERVVGKVKEWQAKGMSQKDLAYELFGREMLPKWQRRLAQMRGEPADKIKKGESDPFVRQQVLKLHTEPNEGKIRRAIDSELRKVGLGDDHNAGNIKKLMEILGLTDEKIGEDVGEI